VKNALHSNRGLLRLKPAWVPRAFLVPGGRLKLHPDDLYALGADRGGIDERWLASTTNAENGPKTPKDEGLSYVVLENGEQMLLREVIELAGDEILGSDVMKKHGGWKVLCKFFDNQGPIPHHMHQMEDHAQNVGKSGKPEAYYFPPQLNMKSNNFPYTFFGFEPGTTKEQVKQCLKDWNKGDNGILYLSKAYKLKPGTGWRVPAGVLHAPGSLVTYEPQRPYDIYGMFQSMVEDRYVPWDLLVKDVPEDKKQDLDYIISMLDWDENVDPEFGKNHFVEPKPVRDEARMKAEGYCEKWIVFGTDDYSSTELTIYPGQTVVRKDKEAYGFIALQGCGTANGNPIETPVMIRFGELTQDEYFVSKAAAESGVTFVNTSATEDLVLIKHLGPKA
jgi:hypothetical protein